MTHELIFSENPMGSLERQMEELMDHLLRRRFTPASYQRMWAPRVDVYESASAFVAIVELAGVDQDSVAVEVEDQEVAIVGERALSSQAPGQAPGAEAAGAEGAQEGLNCLQLEVPYGPFERRLILPVPVDAGKASASFEAGILRITLPKAGQHPKRVQVPIQ